MGATESDVEMMTIQTIHAKKTVEILRDELTRV